MLEYKKFIFKSTFIIKIIPGFRNMQFKTDAFFGKKVFKLVYQKIVNNWRKKKQALNSFHCELYLFKI